MKIQISGVVLTTLLAASAVFASRHTALNGSWTLIPARSDFAGQSVIQPGTVTINERQGKITVARNFAYESATGTTFYRDMIDSDNSATIHSGKDFKTKAKWDHDALKVTTTQPGAVTLETYTLAADGIMTVNVARQGRKPITLLFERK